MMTTTRPAEFTLLLSEEERDQLLQLLEDSLGELRVERRRTEAPEYQVEVSHQVAIVRQLAEKLRRLGR